MQCPPCAGILFDALDVRPALAGGCWVTIAIGHYLWRLLKPRSRKPLRCRSGFNPTAMSDAGYKTRPTAEGCSRVGFEPASCNANMARWQYTRAPHNEA